MSDMVSKVMAAEITTNTNVLEIMEKEAPDDIYSVPEGYAEKKELSRTDLMN